MTFCLHKAINKRREPSCSLNSILQRGFEHGQDVLYRDVVEQAVPAALDASAAPGRQLSFSR